MKFFSKLKVTRTQLISAVVLASSIGVSLAVTIPVTFTAGTAAKAADVNSNFSALATAVTALETKLSAIGTNKALGSQQGLVAYANIGMANLASPDAGNVFNPSSGAVTASRFGVGSYSVTFSGFSSTPAGGGLQITPYAGPAIVNGTSTTIANVTCGGYGGAGATAGDLVVSVNCFTANTGAAVDAPFNVTYIK